MDCIRPPGLHPNLATEAEHETVVNLGATAIKKGATLVRDLATTGANLYQCVKIVDDKKATAVVGIAETEIPAAVSGVPGTGLACVKGPCLGAVSDDAGDVAIGQQLVTSDHGSGGYCELTDGSAVAGSCVGYAMAAQAGDADLADETTLTLVWVDPK
jgi:hypothetical protein